MDSITAILRLMTTGRVVMVTQSLTRTSSLTPGGWLVTSTASGSEPRSGSTHSSTQSASHTLRWGWSPLIGRLLQQTHYHLQAAYPPNMFLIRDPKSKMVTNDGTFSDGIFGDFEGTAYLPGLIWAEIFCQLTSVLLKATLCGGRAFLLATWTLQMRMHQSGGLTD